jgi:cobalt/nickel transport system permease protein
MHISDGILPAQAWASAGVVAGGLAGAILARLDPEKIPRVALCTSFFFVASLVHIPLGLTPAHLMLIGLVGIIMGPAAFLPILFGLMLQALLFQHGGITTIGVNTLTMGLPACAAYYLFGLERRFRFKGAPFVFGFLAGWGAVLLALLLWKSFLILADEAFTAVAWTLILAHQPLALVEGIVTGFAVVFLKKVEPRILEAGHA